MTFEPAGTSCREISQKKNNIGDDMSIADALAHAVIASAADIAGRSREGHSHAQALSHLNAMQESASLSDTAVAAWNLLSIAENGTGNSNLLGNRFGALQLLSDAVKFRWSGPEDEKTIFKETVQAIWLALSNNGSQSQAETVLGHKIAAVSADLAVREWPQQWPQFGDLVLLSSLRKVLEEHQQLQQQQQQNGGQQQQQFYADGDARGARKRELFAALLSVARTLTADPAADMALSMAVQAWKCLAENVYSGFELKELPSRRRHEVTSELSEVSSCIAALTSAALGSAAASGSDRVLLMRSVLSSVAPLMHILTFEDVIESGLLMQTVAATRTALQLLQSGAFAGAETLLFECLEALEAITTRKVSDSERRKLVAVLLSGDVLSLFSTTVELLASESDPQSFMSLASLLSAIGVALSVVLIGAQDSPGSARQALVQLVGAPHGTPLSPSAATSMLAQCSNPTELPDDAQFALSLFFDLMTYLSFQTSSLLVNSAVLPAWQQLLKSEQLFETQCLIDRLPAVLAGAHSRMRKLTAGVDGDEIPGADPLLMEQLSIEFESREDYLHYFSEHRLMLKQLVKIVGVSQPEATLSFAAQVLEYRLRHAFAFEQGDPDAEPDDDEFSALEAAVCFVDATMSAFKHRARFDAGSKIASKEAATEGRSAGPAAASQLALSAHTHPYSHMTIPPLALDEALRDFASGSPLILELAKQLIELLVSAPTSVEGHSSNISDAARSWRTMHILSALQSVTLFLTFSPELCGPLLSKCLTMATFTAVSAADGADSALIFVQTGGDSRFPDYVVATRRKACAVIVSVAAAHPRLVAPLFSELWTQVQQLTQDGALLAAERALLAEALASSATALDDASRDTVLYQLMAAASAEWESVLGTREVDEQSFQRLVFQLLDPEADQSASATYSRTEGARALRSSTMMASGVWRRLVEAWPGDVELIMPSSVADFLPTFASLVKAVHSLWLPGVRSRFPDNSDGYVYVLDTNSQDPNDSQLQSTPSQKFVRTWLESVRNDAYMFLGQSLRCPSLFAVPRIGELLLDSFCSHIVTANPDGSSVACMTTRHLKLLLKKVAMPAIELARRRTMPGDVDGVVQVVLPRMILNCSQHVASAWGTIATRRREPNVDRPNGLEAQIHQENATRDITRLVLQWFLKMVGVGDESLSAVAAVHQHLCFNVPIEAGYAGMATSAVQVAISTKNGLVNPPVPNGEARVRLFILNEPDAARPLLWFAYQCLQWPDSQAFRVATRLCVQLAWLITTTVLLLPSSPMAQWQDALVDLVRGVLSCAGRVVADRDYRSLVYQTLRDLLVAVGPQTAALVFVEQGIDGQSFQKFAVNFYVFPGVSEGVPREQSHHALKRKQTALIKDLLAEQARAVDAAAGAVIGNGAAVSDLPVAPAPRAILQGNADANDLDSSAFTDAGFQQLFGAA